MKQPLPSALLLAGATLALQLAAPRAAAQSTATGPVRQLWVANDAFYSLPAQITALKVATDAAGNVYTLSQLIGGKNSTGSFVTSKYSPSGQQLWRNQYSSGSPTGSYAADLAVDATGNVYVTGSSVTPFTFRDVYTTIRYSTAGYQQWVSQYQATGADVARAIALDASGNAYVTGSSGGDYATVKYNAAGQQQWASRYSNGSGEEATDIAVDASGNAYVTGNANGNFATVKYNAAGQQQWASIYDSGGADAARAVAVDAAGSVVVTGSSATDYATVKYAASGQQQWAARYNGPGNGADAPQALALDAAGGVYVTGASAGAGTGTDYATLRYAPTGQQQWVARYSSPGSSNDQANDLALDAAGNVYVTGGAVGYTTIKYDPAGQQQWLATYANTDNVYNAPGPASARSIAVDAQANVIVSGNANTLYNLTNVATVKYVQDAAGCNALATEPAVPNHTLSTAGGTPLLIAPAYLLSGATDPLGRTLQVASVAPPSVGAIVRNADGTYTYTPPVGFSGTATLGYVVQETGPVLASPATGHYYEYVSAPGLCWKAAQAAAAARTYRGLRGYLATITYQGEQDFVRGRMDGQYWFGASDAAAEGDWRWATGPEAGTLIWKGNASGYGLAYTNWLAGQPDDYKNQYRPQGEDYGMLYAQSGFWNDLDECGTGASVDGYLVEYGGLEPCTPILYTLGTLTINVGSAAQTAAARLAASGSAAATPAAPDSAPIFEATPNPSSGQFRVRLGAAQAGPVQLELFDMQGRRVRALFSGSLAAGETRELAVDGTDLATGLYQLRLLGAEGPRTLRLSVQP